MARLPAGTPDCQGLSISLDLGARLRLIGSQSGLIGCHLNRASWSACTSGQGKTDPGWSTWTPSQTASGCAAGPCRASGGRPSPLCRSPTPSEDRRPSRQADALCLQHLDAAGRFGAAARRRKHLAGIGQPPGIEGLRAPAASWPGRRR
jgi:hypothetical protein